MLIRGSRGERLKDRKKIANGMRETFMLKETEKTNLVPDCDASVSVMASTSCSMYGTQSSPDSEREVAGLSKVEKVRK